MLRKDPASRLLPEVELLVLLALRQLDGEGYGYTIQMTLAISARHEVCLGTICKTLNRLQAKGFVDYKNGLARRKHYFVTPSGAAAIARTLRAIERLTAAAPPAHFAG